MASSGSVPLIWRSCPLRLTRSDGLALMHVAATVPLQVHGTPYRLQRANTALDDQRAGRFTGAAVLRIAPEER